MMKGFVQMVFPVFLWYLLYKTSRSIATATETVCHKLLKELQSLQT